MYTVSQFLQPEMITGGFFFYYDRSGQKISRVYFDKFFHRRKTKINFKITITGNDAKVQRSHISFDLVGSYRLRMCTTALRRMVSSSECGAGWGSGKMYPRATISVAKKDEWQVIEKHG